MRKGNTSAYTMQNGGRIPIFYEDVHGKDHEKEESDVSNVYSILSMLLTLSCTLLHANKIVIYLALLLIFFCLINVKAHQLLSKLISVSGYFLMGCFWLYYLPII